MKSISSGGDDPFLGLSGRSSNGISTHICDSAGTGSSRMRGGIRVPADDAYRLKGDTKLFGHNLGENCA